VDHGTCLISNQRLSNLWQAVFPLLNALALGLRGHGHSESARGGSSTLCYDRIRVYGLRRTVGGLIVSASSNNDAGQSLHKPDPFYNIRETAIPNFFLGNLSQQGWVETHSRVMSRNHTTALQSALLRPKITNSVHRAKYAVITAHLPASN
jgi:hypothetical protein